MKETTEFTVRDGQKFHTITVIEGERAVRVLVLPYGLAIKTHCQRRCRQSAQEVGACDDYKCTLWPYRQGHNPNRAGIGRRLGKRNKRISGKFLPSQDGKKKILETVSDGKTRIRVIVERKK